jgi:hypothetical protein
MTRALEEESSVAALIEPVDESPHENAAYRPPRPVGETPARTERCDAECGGYEQARAELTSELDELDEIICAEERAHTERAIRVLVGDTPSKGRCLT